MNIHRALDIRGGGRQYYLQAKHLYGDLNADPDSIVAGVVVHVETPRRGLDTDGIVATASVEKDA